jgi:hypothetical protein
VWMISGRAVVMEICPGGGNECAAAVWKDEDELELTPTMRPTQDGEGPAFERVVWTGDRYGRWEAFEVGSMWRFPSTRWTTSGCSGWSRTGWPTDACCG